MKTEHGVPVPRGVPKHWKAASLIPASGGKMLRGFVVPSGWGDPKSCVVWFDRFGRCRVCVGHYANGRSALVRIDAYGVWKTTFGDVE